MRSLRKIRVHLYRRTPRREVDLVRGFPLVSEVFFCRESHEWSMFEDHAAHCRMAR